MSDDEIHFPRHAVDSTDLLWRAVDEDTLPEGEEAKVLRKGEVA